MADPRIAIHQNFDLIRCRMCNRIYQEPKLLPCLHSFCLPCLQSYIDETIPPSEMKFSCPICQETIDLPPMGGVKDLTANRILERFIGQTQRDQTMIVAGREALELQRQALTEVELQSPQIMSTVQQIAITAGHVIANGMAEKDQIHSYDTVKERADLQTRMKCLQDQSIGIIHCIDHVNQGITDWTTNKSKIREMIKDRSMELQDSIRNLEKDLLSRLDDRDHDNNVKEEAHKVKTELLKTLKANLTAIDFIRLLKEHGTHNDIETCLPLVEQKEEKLTRDKIFMDKESFAFDFPKVDLQDSVMMMFGSLSQITEEITVWDPADFEIEEVSIQSRVEMTNYGQVHETIFENSIGGEPQLSEENDDLYSQQTSDNGITQPIMNNDTGYQYRRRRPLQSSKSFDSSFLSSQEPATGSKGSNRYGYQLVYETDDTNYNANEQNQQESNISTAIASLAPSIDPIASQRLRSRRVSAPSMIIDSLTRKRLNALSILERANINTEGLLRTSDIESGLSQARLEWLRENVKRKENMDRSFSTD